MIHHEDVPGGPDAATPDAATPEAAAAGTRPTESLPTEQVPLVPGVPAGSVARFPPYVVTGVATLVVIAILSGLGGLALLDQEQQRAAITVLPSSPSPSPSPSPTARYRPVSNLCRYVDASGFGEPSDTYHTDRPPACVLVFLISGSGVRVDPVPGAPVIPGGVVPGWGAGPVTLPGVLEVTADVRDDARSAADEMATRRHATEGAWEVGDLGDAAFGYRTTEKIRAVTPRDGLTLPDLRLSALHLVVHDDNLVLTLDYGLPPLGSQADEDNAGEQLAGVAAATLNRLATA